MRYTLGDSPFDRPTPVAQPLGLRQIMDRLLEHAVVAAPDSGGQVGSVGGPALNAYDEGDHVVIEAQLPGVKPEDIDVSVEQGMLTIRGETQAEEERKGRTYLIREHRTGSFSRSVRLPETVDSDAVQATYRDGVLRLRLPKVERTKAHRIQIEVGDQRSVAGAQAPEPGTTASGTSGPSTRTM